MLKIILASLRIKSKVYASSGKIQGSGGNYWDGKLFYNHY